MSATVTLEAMLERWRYLRARGYAPWVIVLSGITYPLVAWLPDPFWNWLKRASADAEKDKE